VLWAATISIFLRVAKCGSICRAQTCAQYGVEPSRSAKAFLQGGPKHSKKIGIFHHFVPMSQKLFRQPHLYERTEKALSLPYSTVACVWTNRSRVSTG